MTAFEQALATIQVLFRQPDTLSLWGIPYQMRPGQSPKDIWQGRTISDTLKTAQGWYGAMLPDPGPGKDWIWLGCPGWWGTMDAEKQAAVTAFLAQHKDAIPGGPNEFCNLKEGA